METIKLWLKTIEIGLKILFKILPKGYTLRPNGYITKGKYSSNWPYYLLFKDNQFIAGYSVGEGWTERTIVKDVWKLYLTT